MEHMKYINNVYLAADAEGKMMCLVVKSAGVLEDDEGVERKYVVFLNPQMMIMSSNSRMNGILTNTGNIAIIEPLGYRIVIDLTRPILTADGQVQR